MQVCTIVDTTDNDSDEVWHKIKKIILKAADSCISRQAKKRRSSWLSGEAIEIADRRRKMKMNGTDIK